MGPSARRAFVVLAAIFAVIIVTNMLADAKADASTLGPDTTRHYVPNGDQFDSAGNFIPSAHGFNVADIGVDDTSRLKALKPGVKALLWVGTCGGATTTFKNRVNRVYNTGSTNRKKVLAFFLIDEPDPTGIWHSPKCYPSKLKAMSDYVHSKGFKSFITLMQMSGSNERTISFDPGYHWNNSHVDYFGVSVYPCRTNNGTSGRCDFSEIHNTVTGAAAWLHSRFRIVPIYQAFGGGSWEPEGDGKFTVPTADEVRQQLAAWRKELPTVPFDMAYSWGEQEGDTALVSPGGAEMLSAFEEHNNG